jgi:hypothetical protein
LQTGRWTLSVRRRNWFGNQASNLEPSGSEPDALPLAPFPNGSPSEIRTPIDRFKGDSIAVIGKGIKFWSAWLASIQRSLASKASGLPDFPTRRLIGAHEVIRTPIFRLVTFVSLRRREGYVRNWWGHGATIPGLLLERQRSCSVRRWPHEMAPVPGIEPG